MKQIICALDVGTTKTTSLISEVVEGEGISVLGVGVSPSSGMSRGVVSDIDEVRESIQVSIKQAEHVSGVSMERAYVGVGGKHVESFNTHGVVTVSRDDRVIHSSDVRRVVEAAKSIDIPSDRRVIHVIPRGYTLDGQGGIREPVGMHGFRLDSDVHVVTASISPIQNLVKCIRVLGVGVAGLVLSSLASAEAVLNSAEKEAGVILADIGGGTTDVTVIKEGNVYHTAVLPVGGNQVTRDVSLGLGIPFDSAQKIKEAQGSMAPGEVVEETVISDESNGYHISSQELNYIIRVRVEEILKLILLELPSSVDPKVFIPGGVVLTGGSANLPGIAEAAQKIFEVPSRVGIPWGLDGLADTLHNPVYSTAVGLTMWGAERGKVAEYAGVGVQEEGEAMKRFWDQVVNFFTKEA
jgi:cell division protein FtsA